MISEDKSNGWSEYQKLVMSKLEDLHNSCISTQKSIVDLRDDTQKEINNLRISNVQELGKLQTEIALVKQKAGFFGAVAGVATATITLVASYIKSVVTK